MEGRTHRAAPAEPTTLVTSPCAKQRADATCPTARLAQKCRGIQSHICCWSEHLWSSICLVFWPGITEGTIKTCRKIQETGKKKKHRSSLRSSWWCWKADQAWLYDQGDKCHGHGTCFGVGVQEEGAQTQSVSQSHTSQVAVTDVCDCSAGDSSVSRKVFWAVANEAIAVEDFRWNRMFF